MAAGADVNRVEAHGGSWETPLMAAASRGDLALVRLLTEASAKINACSGKGLSALDLARSLVDEVVWAGFSRCPRAVEPQAKLAPRGDQRPPFVGTAVAAGAGIERPIEAVRGIRRLRNVGARTKAGVDQALMVETRERRRIVVAVFALPERRRRKAKPEPGEIVDDGGLELRLAARPVQVFDAQQHAAAQFAREALVDQRRIGVAEMERPIRRGREAQDRRGRWNVIGHGHNADV